MTQERETEDGSLKHTWSVFIITQDSQNIFESLQRH